MERDSRDLFVPRYDSYPMNPEIRGSRVICLFRATIHTPWTQKKRHSFLKWQKINQTTWAQIADSVLFFHHWFQALMDPYPL